MARTPLSIDTLTLNGGKAVTWTVFDHGTTGANGLTFTGMKDDSMLLVESLGATGTVFINPGVYTNGLTGLRVTSFVNPLATNVITFEDSRCRQSDGSIQVDIGGMTGRAGMVNPAY